MAQSVRHLTLDFSSGHDLTVREIEPLVGLHADSTEPAWDSPSPSLLSLPLPSHLPHMLARALSLSLSLSQINLKNKILWGFV